MNTLIEGGKILRKKYDGSLAFVLQEDSLFLGTAYKVLQKQEKNGLVTCTKVTHNGKNKLVYDVQKYRTLASVLGEMKPMDFKVTLFNLFFVLYRIKENGFLNSDNIILNVNEIYINTTDFRVYLIYLPIDTGITTVSDGVFERKVKSFVKQIFEDNPNIKGGDTDGIVQCISYEDSNLEDIRKVTEFGINVCESTNSEKLLSQENDNLMHEEFTSRLQTDNRNLKMDINLNIQPSNEKKPTQKEKRKKRFWEKPDRQGSTEKKKNRSIPEPKDITEVLAPERESKIVFVCLDACNPLQIEITKPEFIIGKSEDQVDASIRFSRAISRSHCKVVYDQGHYFIMDLNSANGTFVNERRLNIGERSTIKNGDKIKLANTVFLVQMV